MKTSLIAKVLLFGVVVLLGCRQKPAPAPPPPPSVSVTQPVQREVVEWDEYTGRLESPETVEIRARVNGYLEKVHFKEGKEIKKGGLLFTIDPRPYRAEAERAEAEHERAQSQEQLARNDAERAARLIETKAISVEEFDTKTRLQVSAAAAVKSAKAALDLARLNLEFTEVRSPIDGRTSRAIVTEGNLISGGLGGTGATLLTTVVSQDPLYCYVDVDEQAILKYLRLRKEGKRVSARDAEIPVEVALANDTGFPHAGFVDFVDNKVDPSTGTVLCRGVIANSDHSLSPGLFARVRIHGSGQYNAFLLPDRAFGSDQSQKFVYVVGADNKVEYRPVKLGPIIDGLRVVKEGLRPLEKVVVEGLIRIRPGVVVDAKPFEAR